MADTFDPYEQWLGIRPHEHPVDHYRLLGLAQFESDPAVIAAAADRWMLHVRTFQTGRRSADSQRIMTQLSAAKTCLLDRDTKATYDAVLQGVLAASAGAQSKSAAAAAAAAAAQVATPPEPSLVAAGASAGPPPPPQFAPQTAAIRDDEEPYEPSLFAQSWFLALAAASLLFALASVLAGVLVVHLSQQREAAVELPVDQPAPPVAVQPVDKDAGLIAQGDDGSLVFDTTDVTLQGSLRVESQGGRSVVTGIQSTDDICRWRFRIEKPAAFRIDATYAAPPESEGGQFTLAVGREVTKPLSVRNTGGADSFTRERIGFIWVRKSGRHELVLRPVALPPGASLMTLESLRLVPVTGSTR